MREYYFQYYTGECECCREEHHIKVQANTSKEAKEQLKAKLLAELGFEVKLHELCSSGAREEQNERILEKVKKVKPHQLIQLDLTQGDEYYHPDIKENTKYLILTGDTDVDGRNYEQYSVGEFRFEKNNFFVKERLIFSGCSYWRDKEYKRPGTDSSDWIAIWEIKEG